jgi:2-polyprenyl-6-methoxyphenol hydroxylase-like FAD-dependent oxidoreductase
VGWMLEGSERIMAPGATADFSFRVASMCGEGWIVVGDAGGFIDPLFSTGAHLAMYGALSGADAVHALLDTHGVTAERLASWEQDVRAGADLFTGVVQAFYSGDLIDYIFADPQHPFLRRSITSLLSGDVFVGDQRWVREMRTRFPRRL